MTATAVLGKADCAEHRMQPTVGRDRPEPELHRTCFLLFLGVGDHHLKPRSAPGLQIRYSEMKTNFLKYYFSVWKEQGEFHKNSLSQYFFSSFSWPHKYKHMKVQQNQNWIHILNLAACCNWILTLSPSLNSLSKTLPLKALHYSEGHSYPLNWRGWWGNEEKNP